jgi:hypothetical protein
MYAKPTNIQAVRIAPRPAVPYRAPALPATPANLLTQVLSALAWNG